MFGLRGDVPLNRNHLVHQGDAAVGHHCSAQAQRSANIGKQKGKIWHKKIPAKNIFHNRLPAGQIQKQNQRQLEFFARYKVRSISLDQGDMLLIRSNKRPVVNLTTHDRERALGTRSVT